jgi:Fibronectin type III domain
LKPRGAGTRFSLSWDETSWQEVGESLDSLFPATGPARYEYRLRCELPEGARLNRLAIVNDLQMAPLALPGMVVGENRFTYTDQSTGPRRVRLTHEWVERSTSRPPGAPPAPVSPADGEQTDGTDVVFQWRPPEDSGGDGVADYHLELSERADMACPLSSNFSKLVSNTADRGQPRYTVPYTGLLTPGRAYYWRVRARNEKGVWGPWSKTWSFTAGGPAQPVDVTLEPGKGTDHKVTLRWKPNPAGRQPVKYRVYGSDEKGFSVSDEPYRRNVGRSRDVPAQAPANFVAETSNTELAVLGAGVDLPNANRAFYRVVAVDDSGKRSGPSDYAAVARPIIYSKPPDAARVGTEFRYQVSSVRSLGDLRLRIVEGKEVASFWDIEKPRFVLVQGPTWLRTDESTGVLRGVPDAAGNTDVVVKVTLERPVRRLDEGRLSWGQELVKEVVTEKMGSTMQRFRVSVAP